MARQAPQIKKRRMQRREEAAAAMINHGSTFLMPSWPCRVSSPRLAQDQRRRLGRLRKFRWIENLLVSAAFDTNDRRQPSTDKRFGKYGKGRGPEKRRRDGGRGGGRERDGGREKARGHDTALLRADTGS